MYKFFVILLLFSGKTWAQSPDSVKVETPPDIFEEILQIRENGGTTKLKAEPALNELLKLHIRANREHKTVSGYRIQIFSGNSYDYSIEQLQQIKSDFEKEFPDIPVYLNYFDPDFKIRAGNFRNRLDCIPLLKRIRRKHPSSYPVKTEIPIGDLIKIAHPTPAETLPDTEDHSEEKSMF